jgi:hypothetical protein
MNTVALIALFFLWPLVVALLIVGILHIVEKLLDE